MRNLCALHLLLLFLLITLSACAAAGEDRTESLKTTLEERLQKEQGTFAVVFRNLSEPFETVEIGADIRFHAASTMKTPVMIELFRRVERGEFSLEDSIAIKNRFYSIVDGSEFELDLNPEGNDPMERRVGERESIYNLVHAMITYSSNIATNLLLRQFEPSQVTETMRELGAGQIEVLRGLFDMKAFELGINNTTTARDLAVIFEKLAKGEAVSREADRQMIRILEDQFYRDIIPALLPDRVRVANKTGSITGVVHDSGIVKLPDGRRYVLIFLSGDLPDNSRGRQTGAEISRIVYDYLGGG